MKDDEPLPLYPESPMKRGMARVYFDDKSYYFGRHGTPESYELFAEWLRELTATGEAPEASAIRTRLNSRKPISRTRQIWSRSVIVVTAAILVTGAITSSYIISSNWVPTVDGEPLSELEIARVNQLRYFEALKQEMQMSDPQTEAMKAEVILDQLLSAGLSEDEKNPSENIQRVFGNPDMFTPFVPEREPGESVEDYARRIADLKPVPQPELPDNPDQADGAAEPIDEK